MTKKNQSFCVLKFQLSSATISPLSASEQITTTGTEIVAMYNQNKYE
jgi:hypothetical protein